MQSIIVDVGESLASALELLLIVLEEVKLTHVNPRVIMAKLLGWGILHYGLCDDYAVKAA